MKTMIDKPNNLFLNAMQTLLHGLKEWTDPAYEGSPFDTGVSYSKSVRNEKPFLLRRKAMVRV